MKKIFFCQIKNNNGKQSLRVFEIKMLGKTCNKPLYLQWFILCD